MLHLYEYDEKLRNLLALDTERAVDTETGEILTADEVDQLVMDRNKKLEGCMLFYTEQKAEADALAAEIKKLTARKKAVENKISWLHGYIANSLNGETFSTARVKASYRTSKSVVIDCPVDALPKEFLRIKTEPDKTALSAAINGGAEIPGVSIAVNKNLQIKTGG